ncbi:MAG: nucleoside deaminase [Flavobacteriaceae bacterium]
MKEYRKIMERCEELAKEAESKGNRPYGSVMMLGGEIIAEAEESAHTNEDVSYHAEMEVIRKARKILGKDMRRSILITNHEPCIMCSYAIRYHRIGTVVFKERATFLGGDGNYQILTTRNVPAAWGAPVRVICLSE